VALPLRARAPGAASAETTTLGDRPVVLARIDPTHRRGALDPTASATLRAAATTALECRMPLVLVIASSGADVTHGVDSLHGWGSAARAIAACSGVVPVVAAVTGPAVSGPALLLGLADMAVMTERAYAYMSGADMVEAFTGVRLTVENLGGSAVHARHSGLAAAVVPDEDGALTFLAAALSYLPAHVDEEPPVTVTGDPADRPTPEAGELLPPSPSGSYDVRAVVRALVDDGDLLELWSGWAANVMVGLAAVGGRPVGVVANQPLALAGTLDIVASQKAARWVDLCDSFNLPILTLVDTPGFFPGKPLEWRGMIRHGAQLVGAYARATVPRICIVLRKAYGGAYIVMDCKTMGNDLCLAWPTAELAVMGARGAVQILHRRQDDEARARIEDHYSVTHLNPYVAAERGYVDAVIAPSDTRREVAAALALLADKRELLPARHHDNLPL